MVLFGSGRASSLPTMKGLLKGGRTTNGKRLLSFKWKRHSSQVDSSSVSERDLAVSKLSPAQLVQVNDLCERGQCTVARSIELLEISDWDVEQALQVQTKLAVADKELEREQEALLEQELDIYVNKFEEAITVSKKMAEMEKALVHEEAELKRQERVQEIEAKEQELFPEPKEKNLDVVEGDIDDAFSKEMSKNGLQHKSRSGTSVQIKHNMLPPELDVGTIANFEEVEVEFTTPSNSQTTVASTHAEITGVTNAGNESLLDRDPSQQLPYGSPPASPIKPGSMTPETSRRASRKSSPFRPKRGMGNRALSQSFSNLELLIDLSHSEDVLPGRSNIDILGGLNTSQSMQDIADLF